MDNLISEVFKNVSQFLKFSYEIIFASCLLLFRIFSVTFSEDLFELQCFLPRELNGTRCGARGGGASEFFQARLVTDEALASPPLSLPALLQLEALCLLRQLPETLVRMWVS